MKTASSRFFLTRKILHTINVRQARLLELLLSDFHMGAVPCLRPAKQTPTKWNWFDFSEFEQDSAHTYYTLRLPDEHMANYQGPSRLGTFSTGVLAVVERPGLGNARNRKRPQ